MSLSGFKEILKNPKAVAKCKFPMSILFRLTIYSYCSAIISPDVYVETFDEYMSLSDYTIL